MNNMEAVLFMTMGLCYFIASIYGFVHLHKMILSNESKNEVNEYRITIVSRVLNGVLSMFLVLCAYDLSFSLFINITWLFVAIVALVLNMRALFKTIMRQS